MVRRYPMWLEPSYLRSLCRFWSALSYRTFDGSQGRTATYLAVPFALAAH